MSRKRMWTLAAQNGLYLSLLTIVIELVKTVFLKNPVPALGIALTLLKTGGSAYILYYFMKSYSRGESYVSYSESFRYGFITCLFSSIACSIFIVMIYTLIAPDILEGIVQTSLQTYEQMGISLPGIDYDSMMKMIPTALTISQLFNCIFFGLLFSLIMANYTKKGNFFTTPTNKEEE